MIQLHPIPDAKFACSYCYVDLDVKGWEIPGMRTLAKLKCPACAREFYGDLPAGHGLYYPMLMEKTTGKISNESGVEWFSNWLSDSYQNRVDEPVGLHIEQFRKPENPIILNCLDGLYGHSLLKLLGADYYLTKQPDLDVIVLIPASLRWLVPDGVAEIWSLEAPLSMAWNEWLAKRIQQLVQSFSACKLGIGLSHPHPNDFNIEKFTRVKPFRLSEWDQRLTRPRVTFIWRENRCWLPAPATKRFSLFADAGVRYQFNAVVELFKELKRVFVNLDFCVIGLGRSGKFPEQIKDLRRDVPDAQTEREWCEHYSQSLCVIGIHGSNMLLPSALAGSVIELVPQDRWGNLVQDILVQTSDVREAMFRNQFIPSTSAPSVVADICKDILTNYPHAMLNFKYPWVDHNTVMKNPTAISAEFRTIKEKTGKG